MSTPRRPGMLKINDEEIPPERGQGQYNKTLLKIKKKINFINLILKP